MPGVIHRGTFPKALLPTVKTWFDDMMEAHPLEWRRIFRTLPTDMAFEQDVGYTGFGLMAKKDEAKSVYWDTAEQGFTQTYTVVDYALGFQISKNAVKDDKSNRLLRNMTEALSRSCRETPEVIAANIFNRAFSASYTGMDGKPLCATDHPQMGSGGGVQANRPTADTDLSEAALEDGLITIRKWQNGKGIRENVQSRALLCSADDEYEAYRITESPQRVGTANNDLNAIRGLAKFPEGTLSWTYLTDSDAWWILTNADNAFKCYEREALDFGEVQDFDTFLYKFIAFMRAVWGWTRWQGCYGSSGY